MLGEHVLAPGAKTTLKIVYDTKDRPGPFRKVVTISTDIPGQEEIEVTVEGTVGEAPGAKIQVHPRKALLGVLKPGASARQEFTVTNNGNRPLNITKVSSRQTGITCLRGAGRENLSIDPGTTEKLEIEVKATESPGRVEERVAIESNARNAPKSGYVVIIQYTVSEE